eukprot:COSAG01_NODE_1896_length_8969_cov_35.725028_3_plen_38_part_00
MPYKNAFARSQPTQPTPEVVVLSINPARYYYCFIFDY